MSLEKIFGPTMTYPFRGRVDAESEESQENWGAFAWAKGGVKNYTITIYNILDLNRRLPFFTSIIFVCNSLSMFLSVSEKPPFSEHLDQLQETLQHELPPTLERPWRRLKLNLFRTRFERVPLRLHCVSENNFVHIASQGNL